jgi:hypothetical protein
VFHVYDKRERKRVGSGEENKRGWFFFSVTTTPTAHHNHHDPISSQTGWPLFQDPRRE